MEQKRPTKKRSHAQLPSITLNNLPLSYGTMTTFPICFSSFKRTINLTYCQENVHIDVPPLILLHLLYFPLFLSQLFQCIKRLSAKSMPPTPPFPTPLRRCLMCWFQNIAELVIIRFPSDLIIMLHQHFAYWKGVIIIGWIVRVDNEGGEL